MSGKGYAHARLGGIQHNDWSKSMHSTYSGASHDGYFLFFSGSHL